MVNWDDSCAGALQELNMGVLNEMLEWENIALFSDFFGDRRVVYIFLKLVFLVLLVLILPHYGVAQRTRKYRLSEDTNYRRIRFSSYVMSSALNVLVV